MTDLRQSPESVAARAAWEDWGLDVPNYRLTEADGTCHASDGRVVHEAIGCAKVVWVGATLVDAEIVLRTDLCNASEDRSCYDRQGAETHEIGHLFGIQDQPMDHKGTMSGWVDRGSVSGRDVTDRDVALIHGTPGYMVCSSGPETGGGLAAGPVLLAIALFLAVLWGRWR